MFRLDPKKYDEFKLRAVTHGDGPMLVLAVAGSGKTYAITHRIAYLIDVCGVPPEQIVAVSFTNKAARELRHRVALLVGKESAHRCQLSTFHAMGLEILKHHITKLGWKNPFAILDDSDQKKIIKDVCKNYHFVGSDFDPDKLLHLISLTKNYSLPPEQMFPAWSPRRNSFVKIFNDYQSMRKSMNVIDFDDMIQLPVELFETYPEILAKYEHDWQYLLVDEYQDTNALQFKLIQLLCSHHANIMVVGDDDQAIYAFRGAQSEHILNFPNMFENVEVVKFQNNFRSTQLILDAANSVIEKNENRYEKHLFTDKGDGEKIRCFSCPTPEEEGFFVAEQITQQRAARNLNYRDFAILYRANNQAEPLEAALIKLDIPYHIVGGKKFFDHAEIRDLVFYMRAALSPDDELALRRIVNVPRRGIAAASLEAIDLVSREQKISFFEALKRESEGSMLKADSRIKLRHFVETIETFHRRFAERKESLAATMRDLIEAIHFKEWIASSSTNDVQTNIRIQNIHELLSQLSLFEHTDAQDLMGFLHKIASDPPTGEKDDPTADEVKLMTLHSSKGLEFPAVFIVGCEERLLPHANALDPPDANALCEERRLFYVGITRAKKFLTLTRSKTRRDKSGSSASAPSRFLDDIPERCIEVADAHSETAEKLKKENEKTARDYLAAMRELLK